MFCACLNWVSAAIQFNIYIHIDHFYIDIAQIIKLSSREVLWLPEPLTRLSVMRSWDSIEPGKWSGGCGLPPPPLSPGSCHRRLLVTDHPKYKSASKEKKKNSDGTERRGKLIQMFYGEVIREEINRGSFTPSVLIIF